MERAAQIRSLLFAIAFVVGLFSITIQGAAGGLENGLFVSSRLPRDMPWQSHKEIPIVCGSGNQQVTASAQFVSSAKKPPPPPPPIPVLPVGMRMWQTIPGVIRNNGTDTCRVELNGNGAISNAIISMGWFFLSESGQTSISLHDDGSNGDRVAGDGIFTSELIRFNTNHISDFPANYEYDPTSPAGAMPYAVGDLTMFDTNGTQSTFLYDPEAGVLDRNIPLVQTVQLSTNVIIAPHLINVLGTNLFAQKLLRNYTYETGELPKKLYAVLPDGFDLLVYFSTYRLEYVPDAYDNGVAGIHQGIQVNFTGTGQGLYDNSALCGSQGRLLGVIGLDTYERGMSSGICTHEIIHQWASHMPAFPFSDGSHYLSCNVGSPVGGSVWDDNGAGGWTLNCDYLNHLDVFDQYLMGLAETNVVKPILVCPSSLDVYCGGIISSIISTNTIQDVINTYGPRTPGPATAQRHFSIGFVAESYQRLLTPVEMTYYEIFAAHYTEPIPAGQPDPYIKWGWASAANFYGGGTTWRSEVLSLIQPVIQSFQLSPDGHCTIAGKGLANRTYHVEFSTNLQSWVAVTNLTADVNGVFTFNTAATNTAGNGFYRAAWP